MANQHLLKSKLRYDVVGGIVVGFCVLVVAVVGYFALGIWTHVIGVCSGASATWTKIFHYLFFAIPLGAVSAGCFSHQQFKRARLKKLAANQHAT